jgi:acetyl esterase/lipase
MTRWLGLVIGLVVLWFAIWIYLPAPTYFFLTFSVGAPEISAWLIVGSVIGISLSLVDSHSRAGRLGAAASAIAFLLALSVWVRVRGTIRLADDEMRQMSAEPAMPLRAKPIVLTDLFRHIALGNAKIVRDVPFASRSGVQLHADVYRPTRDGVFPIVVQIYGGAWQRGTPSDFSNFATWLASSGYVVIAIDYRHAPASRWPAQIDDVRTGLTWVGAHASEFGGDPSRMVLIGRSAGAHLATMAAWTSPPVRIRGVVSYYGPVDLVESFKNPPRPDPLNVRSVEGMLIGGSLRQMPARYADASTITHVRAGTMPLPPTLLIYGGHDHVVEAKYGRTIVNALRARGTQVGYIELPWADHAFDEVFNGPSSQIALYYTERFIAWAVQSPSS